MFRLGNKRGKGASLFESFERLLEELGIQIEFDTDPDVGPEIPRNIRNNGTSDGHLLRKRSRRASFNSMYDAEDESTNLMPTRADSWTSQSRLLMRDMPKPEARPSTRATTRPTEKTSSKRPSIEISVAETTRGRLTAEEFSQNLHNIDPRHASGSSEDGKIADGRRGLRSSRSSAGINAATSAAGLTLSSSSSGVHATDVLSGVLQNHRPMEMGLQERFYTPSRTQLLRDADTFQHHRIRHLAQELLDRWCDAAFQAQTHHEHLQRQAVIHDTDILLRQTIEHWRARMHVRKRVEETERFFSQLERRAAKARNLYLLTKAFTHWAQCAEDQVLQGSADRNQVLGIKFFSAWRDVALENQNKVQVPSLRRFFSVWKRRHVRCLRGADNAHLVYELRLSRIGYWHWFWTFCERRASEWHTRQVKQRLLFNWLNKARTIARQSQVVTHDRDKNATWNILSPWLAKTRISLSNRRKAVTLHDRWTTSHAVQTWVLTRRLAPRIQQISNMVDWRAAGATFAIFVHRFRSEKQAENVDRLRILRGFWTRWNDRLRWQTLAHRIDDRVLVEVLSKWLIAERRVLERRLSERRLKGQYLRTWALQLSKRERYREQAAKTIENRKAGACSRSAMLQWLSQLEKQRQAQHIAFEFAAPKLVDRTLGMWKQALIHTQGMDLWAKDARFFFLGKHYLKRWRDATSESRRRKRREAYIQVRRTSKMALASRLLQCWRGVATQINNVQVEAANLDHQRLQHVATRLFDSWKEKYDLVVDQEISSSSQYEKQLIQRALRTWTEKIDQIWQVEEKGMISGGLRVQRTAFVFLRRLRLRSIEIRGQQGKAQGLRLNYEKRHSINLLRQWRESTALRQERLLEDRSFSARTRRTRRPTDLDNPGIARGADDWTELDVGDWIPGTVAHLNTTPMPDMNTPSRRAADPKALTHSTTPAGTPFQNRLRAQLNATPRTGKRGPFGRSSNLRGSLFRTALENVPRTPANLALEDDE